jgi:hypothetical protein
MKKRSLFSLMFASVAVMLGISSCNKCVECTTSYTYNGITTSYSSTYCKPENFTNKAWKQQLDNIEDNANTRCENL